MKTKKIKKKSDKKLPMVNLGNVKSNVKPKPYKRGEERTDVVKDVVKDDKPLIPKESFTNAESLKIHSTTDYDIFKTILGNRDTDHANKMKKNILEKNLLHISPIIVNENMEIIDGEGRRGGTKLIKEEYGVSLKLYYRIVPGLTIDDARRLSNNNTKWSVVNNAKSYSVTGNDNYTIYRKFRKDYPDISDVSARLIVGNNGKLKPFSDGYFVAIRSEAECKKIAEILLHYKPFFNKKSSLTYRTFVSTIIDLMGDKEYVKNHDEVIRKLANPENHSKLHGVPNQLSKTDYKSIINSVLNHRNKNKVYFRGLSEESISDTMKRINR